MNTLPSSRRDVMRALAIVPAVIVAPSSSAAAGRTYTSATISPGMHAKISAYRAAADESQRFYESVYCPAHDAWMAEHDAIPHLTTQATFRLGTTDYRMSTANAIDVKAATGATPLKPGDTDDFRIACAELREKIAVRDAHEQAVKEQHGLSPFTEEDDRLAAIRDTAMTDVENFPVITLADLIAKVEIIEQTTDQIEPGDVLADLRRLAREDAE